MMSKMSGSYESLIQGVSQQVPQNRRPGQHHEQVNMLSDAVRGLSRRHGSVNLTEQPTITSLGEPAVAGEGVYASWVDRTRYTRVLPFRSNGKEYDLLYRTTPTTSPLTGQTFLCYCKTDDKFVEVFVTADVNTVVVRDALLANGASSAVNLGDYIALAPNNYKPFPVTSSVWNPATDRGFHLWVRGSAFNRTFTVTLIRDDGTRVTASYTTPSAGYPGTLDTSDIAASDSEYTKKVNDRVNAYNSAVTEWITTSAEGASPKGIRNGLRVAVQAALPDALFWSNSGDNGIQWRTTALLTNPVAEIEVSDGGDGSLIRMVGQTIDSVDAVTPYHRDGHIVKVRPKDGDEESVTYLKAVAKSPHPVLTNLPVEVTWQETAGEIVTPRAVFLYGKIHTNSVGVERLILGSRASFIDSAAAAWTGLPAASIDTPPILPSVCGDLVTDPMPRFLKEGIDYLGVFQDRLVIGSGSHVFMSRPGDYFNWFRKSTLSVDDDDPIDLLAYGSESDTIRAGTTFDRSLVLYGSQYQYTINGRVPVTPRNAALVILSAYENAVDASPINSGNFVFYSRSVDNKVSLHQVQTGAVVDSAESYEVSQQLDNYIPGKPVQLVHFTAPNNIVIRTDNNRNGLYLYSYLDNANAQERLFDSWSRWEFAPQMGAIMGTSSYQGNLLVYFIREGEDADGVNRVWRCAERISFDSDLSDRPYLDSLRKKPDLDAVGAINANTPTDNISVAFGSPSELALVGAPLARFDEVLDGYTVEERADLWFGYNYPAFVTPTNPYPRDRKDNAIVNGRMTLGRLSVDLANSGGMIVDVTSAGVTKRVLDNKARIVGNDDNFAGRQPVSSYTASALVGREVRQCEYTLRAQTWLPLTVTGIEWVGQYFNNTRRL